MQTSNTAQIIRMAMAALIAIVLILQAANAVVPAAINYQGYLADNAGNPVNTTVSITFRLYDVNTGGSVLWTETDDVNVVDGQFTTSLGDGMAFSADLFNGAALYLGMEVEADGEMSPRTALTTTPYAFTAQNADALEGKNASQFLSSTGDTGIGNYVIIGNLDLDPGSLYVGSNIVVDNDISVGADLIVGGNARVVDIIMSGGGALTFQDGSAQTTSAVNAILAADGAGSDLDADFLDGLTSNAFLKKSGDAMMGDLDMSSGIINAYGGVDFKNEGNISNLVDLSFGQGLGGGIQFEDGSLQSTNAINSVLAADGVGSGLDADLLDGKNLGDIVAAAKDPWRVVVAPKGGDFRTINAAIKSIKPTAANPFVVEVRPGTYNENVKLKSYVHLKGSGKEITKIFPLAAGGNGQNAEDYAAVAMVNLAAVKVTGFTLAGGDFDGDSRSVVTYGVYDVGSSPVIEDNRFQYFDGGGVSSFNKMGIFSNTSKPQIIRNEFIGNKAAGAYLLHSEAMITKNVFANTGGDGTPECGVANISSKVIVNGNLFNGNTHGVCAYREGSVSATTTVTGNQFVANYNAIYVKTGYAQIIGNHVEASTQNHHFGVFIESDVVASIAGNTIVGYSFGVLNSGISEITGNQINDGPAVDSSAIESHGTSNIVGNMIDNYRRGITDVTGAAQIIGNRLSNISSRNIDSNAQVFANITDNSATEVSAENRVITKQGFRFETTDGSFVVSAGGSSITLSATGNITISSSNDLSINSAGDVTIEAATDLNLIAGNNVNVTGGGDGLIDIDGTTEITASTLTFDATSRLNLSANTEIDISSNNLIDINASTAVDISATSSVDIKASLIQLN